MVDLAGFRSAGLRGALAVVTLSVSCLWGCSVEFDSAVSVGTDPAVAGEDPDSPSAHEVAAPPALDESFREVLELFSRGDARGIYSVAGERLRQRLTVDWMVDHVGCRIDTFGALLDNGRVSGTTYDKTDWAPASVDLTVPLVFERGRTSAEMRFVHDETRWRLESFLVSPVLAEREVEIPPRFLAIGEDVARDLFTGDLEQLHERFPPAIGKLLTVEYLRGQRDAAVESHGAFQGIGSSRFETESHGRPVVRVELQMESGVEAWLKLWVAPCGQEWRIEKLTLDRFFPLSEPNPDS